MLVAGIMSGTSVDAIDVAFVEISGGGRGIDVEVVGFQEIPFPEGVRKEVLEACDGMASAARISQLNILLGDLFAKALRRAGELTGVSLKNLELVGSHGQTIHHQAEPTDLCGFPVASSLQIGEPACIARDTGVPVVADFRTADIASGGQGAPLVPYVDFLLFRHATVNRVALNIGGIANLTALPAGSDPAAVLAFDTGPGNMVIDRLVEEITGGREHFDRNGRMAMQGEADEGVLAELLSDPYYERPAPKSTGREQFGSVFAQRFLASGLSRESRVATATQLTVRTILMGVERLVLPRMPVDELIVSGGGWHNPAIMQPLRESLPSTRVTSTDEFGIAGDAKEAVAFAVLAYETVNGRPGNLTSATGASRHVILGSITPPGF